VVGVLVCRFKRNGKEVSVMGFGGKKKKNNNNKTFLRKGNTEGKKKKGGTMLIRVVSKRIRTNEKLVTIQPHTSSSNVVVGANSLWACCFRFSNSMPLCLQ
jgi:hypothetical protein